MAATLAVGLGLTVFPAAPVEAGGPTTHAYRRIDGHTLHLDAFAPVNSSAVGSAPSPAVVLVHGGGWRNGHRGSGSWAATAQAVAAEGWVAISLDYRLSGVAPFPAAVDDVRGAVVWVRDHADALGVDPDRIALMGGSAGGNLALLATTGAGAVPVAGVVAWSAPTDLAPLAADPRMRMIVGQWLGCDPTVCPDQAAAASPLHRIAGGEAPVFLATGSDEFVPATQATVMHERLVSAGVPSELVVIPGTRHASAYRADVWDATTAFLHTHLAPRNP